MTDFSAGKFTVESNLDLPADGFTTDSYDSSAFLNASDSDRITLKAGYLNESSVPISVTQITDAVVDEHALIVTANSSIVQLTGRDPVANLLDKQIRRRYLRTPDLVDPSVRNLFPNYYTVKVGTFFATTVVADIASDIGKNISWQAPNYQLVEDVDAVMSAFEVIKSLIELFNHTAPFKIDILADGNTIVVRQRQGFSLTPNFIYSAADARILDLSVKRRVLPRYHRVTLTGRKGLPIPITTSIEVDVTESISHSADGGLAIREYQTITRQLPQNVTLFQTSEIYDGSGCIKREYTTFYWANAALIGRFANYYRSVQIDPTVVQLLPVAEVTNIYEANEQGQLVQTHRKSVTYSYDSDRFLTLKVTTEEDQQTTDTGVTYLAISQKVTESYSDMGSGTTRQINTTMSVSDSGTLSVTNTQTSTSSGTRPGGWQPPDTSPKFETYTVDEIVDTDVRGRDFNYTNMALDKLAIDILLSQFKQSSGAKEYELSFRCVGMPWIKKGTVIQITNIPLETGEMYTPDAALVYDVKCSYDESISRASLISTIRAVYWKK